MSTALRLLILEDDPHDAELQVAALKEAGYDCQWKRVDTRAEFLGCLEAPDYDLILADYRLPSFDGLTALELLLERDLDLPFILVSGILGEEMAIESLKAGATDYVSKNHLSRLGPVVRRALGEREERRQRKQAEEALCKSEEKYRNLVETSQDSVVIIDLQGKVKFGNSATEKLTGYSMEEGIGMNVRKITPLKYWPKSYAMLRKARSGKLVPYFESVIKRKDGVLVPVESGGQPIIEDGKVVGVQIITRDTSRRKRAERLLQTLNEAALAMGQALTPEETFAVVAEKLRKLGFSCIVLPADEEQRRLFPKYLSYEPLAIETAEKLVGLRREDFSIPVEAVGVYRNIVQGKKAVFIEDVKDVIREMLPKPADKFASQIARMLKLAKSIAAPLIVEDKVIGLFSVQSADLGEGDLPAITAFAHQMAAAWRKAQLMQDLQNSLEELKRTQAQLLQAQKMEAIGQLVGGICHDFNNLLTPISGFAELLLGNAPEDNEQQEYLHQIMVAAERAAALTRQLRLFTRQAAGERHTIQLNNVVAETHDLLKRSISKEIAVELSPASDLWAVEADPLQIGQVVLNLCLNACDAMPGGGTLTLQTRNVTLDEEYARKVLEARPGRYVRLSVFDTGVGMSPEVQARVFEPFFTTKRVGEGTGLGLAVVYGIVKGHGGFIQIYSQEGQGSAFHVYLPAVEWVVKEAEVAGLELPTGTETILLVDDEKAVRALGQGVLERCGYTVLMAENGVRALEVYQARQGEIGLVVLDVAMPQMGGMECLRRLRRMNPQVKVLISTGYTAKGLAQELMAEGALGAVEKPFRLRDFATAVRTAIDK